MSDIGIRPLDDPREIRAAFDVFLRTMVGLPFRDLDAVDIIEPGRYLGAVDGQTVVGGADSYRGWLTVPGGERVSHAAVTHVGVLPTHRRRGIVRGLMTEQLRDIAARGEVLASLRASEAVIYERFGYGIASSTQSARVRTARAALRPGIESRGEVRLVDRAVTTELLQGIYEGARWTGAIHRPPGWWRLRELMRTGDSTTHYVVVHSTDGVDNGYAIYHPTNTGSWFSSPEKVIAVTDFIALDDNARSGLWQHLLSLDLIDIVEFDALPIDDTLPLAVTDQRSVELGSPHDETWLRLVDVEAALRARTYRAGAPVRIEVRDSLLPENNGVYAVGAESVTRMSAEPDVVVDVATLAAAYLGGTRWLKLAAAGRVGVRTPDAIGCLDALFGVDTMPFAGTIF
ncbi:GNAT family N-acetyltransferase [Gordonia sp. CPCC 205515]|uniref:GNAT family N-acetyltransferase n=1 Tax=Gordonia sp. CPCC 205515 TaxID=3140791 RepID=UPI003AF3781C